MKVFYALLLLLVQGCTTYAPTLRVGVAYDDQEVMGHNPVGVVEISQPLWVGRVYGKDFNWLTLNYLHLSSIPDTQDRHTVNQIGLMFSMPLRRSE